MRHLEMEVNFGLTPEALLQSYKTPQWASAGVCHEQGAFGPGEARGQNKAVQLQRRRAKHVMPAERAFSHASSLLPTRSWTQAFCYC